MLIRLPIGHGGYNTKCRCTCDHDKGERTSWGELRLHDCFGLGAPKLRGYCPLCFNAVEVQQLLDAYHVMHDAFHDEMTRISGWRIWNERSYAKWRDIEEQFGGEPPAALTAHRSKRDDNVA